MYNSKYFKNVCLYIRNGKELLFLMIENIGDKSLRSAHISFSVHCETALGALKCVKRRTLSVPRFNILCQEVIRISYHSVNPYIGHYFLSIRLYH